MIERTSIDFPEPDSPTIPRASREPRFSVTPSRTVVSPERSRNVVRKSDTLMTGSSGDSGLPSASSVVISWFPTRGSAATAVIETTANSLTENVEREHGNEDKRGRHKDLIR